MRRVASPLETRRNESPMRSLEDLDVSRAKAFAKGGGQATPLTVAEQDLRARAERALERLEKARRSGDQVAVAQAKVAVTRLQGELQRNNSARGSLSDMRSALARSMTDVTVR
jgi:hypothetical protein